MTRAKFIYEPPTKEEALMFYKTCRDFLADCSKGQGIDLALYLKPDRHFDRLTLQNIFLQIISSAANSGMKSGVIEFSSARDKQRKNKILHVISGVPNLADEDVKLSDELMREILLQLKELDIVASLDQLKSAQLIKGKRTQLWEGWLRSVKDAASFVSTFASGKEFADFFGQFHGRAIVLGPYFLSRQVYGIAIALACDVLKELGFVELIKPDVHIKDVFYALNLVKTKNSDEAVVESALYLIELANEARRPDEPEITPFELDKIIWLCCSGRFYRHPRVQISGHKEQLIKRLRKVLGR